MEPWQRATLDMVAAQWPLIVGFCALAIPAINVMATQSWSHEDGAHGPLVLFTAAWLLWRQLPEIRRNKAPGRPWVVAVVIAVSIVMYIFGQAFDFVTADAAGLYGVGVAMFYAKFGARAVLRNWFIFFYLLFAVPPPSIWIDAITSPLKQFVSTAATALLQPFGIPVVHQGVVIYVAQYQLLVEDACSGLNSIIGLLAISLFYIYLARGSSWRYAGFLAALAVPVAIVANIVRIVILILLTYFAGDGVAQGFLHFAAGIFIFITALLLIFLLDALIYPIVARRSPA
ncbi:MAG TPA: exosortase V [Rhizomicrobium sp.]|nr:exosortase V [Rhizomicrobium sp.]